MINRSMWKSADNGMQLRVRPTTNMSNGWLRMSMTKCELWPPE